MMNINLIKKPPFLATPAFIRTEDFRTVCKTQLNLFARCICVEPTTHDIFLAYTSYLYTSYIYSSLYIYMLYIHNSTSKRRTPARSLQSYESFNRILSSRICFANELCVRVSTKRVILHLNQKGNQFSNEREPKKLDYSTTQ